MRRNLLVFGAAVFLVGGALTYGLQAGAHGWFPIPWLEAVGLWSNARPQGDKGTASKPKQPRIGMWHKAPARQDDALAVPPALADLANLPYLAGSTTAPETERVTVFDQAAAHPGLNLVVSGHEASAELQDMRGNVLHSWSSSFGHLWPDGLPFKEAHVHRTFWRRAHVYPNGDLLAIYEGFALIKLNRYSNLLWTYPHRAHHDLQVMPDGRIYTLIRQWRDDFTEQGRDGPPLFLLSGYLDDQVVVLSPEGQEQQRVSILRCFENSEYASTLMMAPKGHDVLHANTLEVMDGSLVDLHPMFAKGNVLVSLLTTHTVAMLDLERETVVWAAPGIARHQHQPTALANGNILIFDNMGDGVFSRVVEIDPHTLEIRWLYKSTPENPFSSYRLGSCQRLSNGNTLITESVAGRAFEVTPDKGTVWEYVNPHRAGEHEEFIATLFEVIRIEPDYFGDDFAGFVGFRGGDNAIELGGVRALIEGRGK
ncbi:MAG: arylsulfotransferase family protein [Planctomycetota bacterium]